MSIGRKVLFMSVFLLSILCVPGLIETVIAQTPPPPPALPGAPTQAPIDGGLALLAAAGGAYAWKKLRKGHH